MSEVKTTKELNNSSFNVRVEILQGIEIYKKSPFEKTS